MLTLYRSALRLRRELGRGDLAWLPSPEGVLAFHREPGFTCTVNFTGKPVTIDRPGKLLLSSGPLSGDELPADTAAWWRTTA
jgi:alpha-glucosidase